MNEMTDLALPKRRLLTLSAYPIAVFGLALFAGLMALFPAFRAFSHVEVNYNEGWNLYWQTRVAQGLPLYSGHPVTMFCNYPPLSFLVVGFVGALGMDMMLAARLLSLASLAFIAWSCGFVVRRFGGDRNDALLAGSALLLPFLIFYGAYVGSNDPQMLGMAFGMAAMVVHFGGPLTVRRGIVVAALLVACLFTKHNLLALPVAIAADTLWRADNRVRVAFLAAGFALGFAALGLLLAREGQAFFIQLVSPRQWSATRAFDMSQEMLLRHQAPLLLAIAATFAFRPPWSRFIYVYLMLGMVIAVYFSGGAGTAENIWFDVLIACALASGMIVAACRHAGMRPAFVVTVVALATVAPVLSAPRVALLEVEGVAGDLELAERDFEADVAFMAAQPGPALCESLLICLAAGKDPEIDPFNSFQATQTGRLRPDTLTTPIMAQRYGVIQIRTPRGTMNDRFRNFDLATYDAVAARYRPARHSRMGVFSVPEAGSLSAP